MMGKNVGLTIRLDENLRAAFIAQCQREAIPASVVMREFIKRFVAKAPNEAALEFERFSEEEIAFLRERSRLAKEDEKAGRLISAEDAVSDLRNHIAKRRDERQADGDY